MTELQFHPLADIFPLLDPKEQMSLSDDIKAHGLRDPIVMYEGKVLDGRNRHAACIMAGVEPRFVAFEGNFEAARAFVISKNLARRHMTEGERATAAAKLANIKNGGDRVSDQSANLQSGAISQSDAAEMLGVSTRSVASASKVLKEGAPELVAAVERGEVSVSAAAAVATLPKDEQREIVAKGQVAVVEAAKVKRYRPTAFDKRLMERAAKEAAKAAKQDPVAEPEAVAEAKVDLETPPDVNALGAPEAAEAAQPLASLVGLTADQLVAWIEATTPKKRLNKMVRVLQAAARTLDRKRMAAAFAASVPAIARDGAPVNGEGPAHAP